MPGRKRRLSHYTSAALRRVKNVSTRRTTVAIISRDVKKLGSAKKNKRLSK